MPRLSTPKVDPARVFQARDELGVSQEALARKMRCSVNSIKAYESGVRSPGPKLLARLARVTGKPESFFSENGEAA